MKKKNILVVAAHPDDEILGCGGAIAKYAAEGHNVYVTIVSQGVMSRSPGGSQKDVDGLHELCREINLQLGAKEVEFLQLPDNRMDSMDILEVVKKFEVSFAKFKPNIVLTHHLSDLNVDHRICHMAVLTAGRPLPGSTIEKILFFEVPSATDWTFSGSARKTFSPNFFVDISGTLKAKLKALTAYDSEMRPFPHARSVEGAEHLARWRGCSVGVTAAEAFEVGRITEL